MNQASTTILFLLLWNLSNDTEMSDPMKSAIPLLYLILLYYAFCPTSLWAQSLSASEICDNEIDDDADGLFDCLDPDCPCNPCIDLEAPVWWMGNDVKLDFRSGQPIAGVSTRHHLTYEGASAIYDAHDHLIFYIVGSELFDRRSNPMPNGSGLVSHPSSAQMLIIPYPGKKHLFIVICPDSNDRAGFTGVAYYIIDMRLNGGFGDVASGPVYLRGRENYIEKVAAISHCNNRDYWMILPHPQGLVHEVYKIDSNGLNSVPQVFDFGLANESNFGGQCKFSRSGNEFVNVFYNGVQWLEFDRSTGVLSNSRILRSPELRSYWGAEFSSNDRFLYVTQVDGNSALVQFDLSLSDPGQISADSRVVHFSFSNYYFSQLLLGRDQKIYTTNASQGTFAEHLGVIEFPNLKSPSCNYRDKGFTLAPNTGVNIGFPSFTRRIPSSFHVDIVDESAPSGCTFPKQLKFKGISSCPGIPLQWSYPSSFQVLSQSTSEIELSAPFKGEYTIYLTGTSDCGIASDSIKIMLTGGRELAFNIGPDTAFCHDFIYELEAPEGFINYQWSNGQGIRKIQIRQPGIYWACATDSCNNRVCDTLEVKLENTFSVDLGPDLNIQNGDFVQLKAKILPTDPAARYQYQWKPSKGLSCSLCPEPIAQPSHTQKYCLEVINLNTGCKALDCIVLNVQCCK